MDWNNKLSAKVTEIALNTYKVISWVLSVQKQWIHKKWQTLIRFSTDENVFNLENVCNLQVDGE